MGLVSIKEERQDEKERPEDSGQATPEGPSAPNRKAKEVMKGSRNYAARFIQAFRWRKAAEVGAAMLCLLMEGAMNRVIRGLFLGTLVLALGMGSIGCGGETSTTPKQEGIEAAKKAGEGMKKTQEDIQKKKGGAAGGEEAGDKDKNKG